MSKPEAAGAQVAPAAPVSPSGPLDFGWRLSGDRSVAPVQVFSDEHRTWLQWNPGQALPAILAAGQGGEQVLTYARQEPYTIIEGNWPELVFRAGPRRALARRRKVQVVAPATGQVAAALLAQADPQTSARPGEAPDPVARAAYAVTPEDGHLRQALVRWTGLSGWQFRAEHWSVDVDVPISASAAFGDDFVAAVQALMSSTELSDRPLQPCFYSNQVLRVVSASEPCDRTAVAGEPA